MTPLRQDAMSLLEQLPEEKLVYVVEILREMSSSSENSDAYKKLLRLRKRITHLDDSKDTWRGERYARSN